MSVPCRRRRHRERRRIYRSISLHPRKPKGHVSVMSSTKKLPGSHGALPETSRKNQEILQTTLWSISSGGQDVETIHGTQKPVECMRRPSPLDIASDGAIDHAPIERVSSPHTNGKRWY